MIYLVFSLSILYTIICVKSIGKIHKYLCNISYNIYIDFCVVLCYNVYSGKGRPFIGRRKGGETMPIVYKVNIIEALKAKGYNTNRLRKEKLLSEGVLQSLRTNKYISMDNLSKICGLLDCQPADLIAYEKGEGVSQKAD